MWSGGPGLDHCTQTADSREREVTHTHKYTHVHMVTNTLLKSQKRENQIHTIFFFQKMPLLFLNRQACFSILFLFFKCIHKWPTMSHECSSARAFFSPWVCWSLLALGCVDWSERKDIEVFSRRERRKERQSGDLSKHMGVCPDPSQHRCERS